jgi:hypothetical protein
MHGADYDVLRTSALQDIMQAIIHFRNLEKLQWAPPLSFDCDDLEVLEKHPALKKVMFLGEEYFTVVRLYKNYRVVRNRKQRGWVHMIAKHR